MNCHIITSHETVKTISGFDFMARKEGFVFIVMSTKTHIYLISDTHLDVEQLQESSYDIQQFIFYRSWKEDIWS